MRPMLSLAAALLALATPALASPAPQCPGGPLTGIPPGATTPDNQKAALAWGGKSFDAFSLDGVHYTLTEDGGRIRQLDTSLPAITVSNVPSEVQDTVRRSFFLPAPDHMNGWSCAASGWLMRTFDGGLTWTPIFRMFGAFGTSEPFHDLYDIHFLDQNLGWLAGIHGLWVTGTGGVDWSPVCLRDPQGTIVDPLTLEIYAIDVVERSNGALVGLMVAEPGLVYRTTDGILWDQVLDVLDFCGGLPSCMDNTCAMLPGTTQFEPWDVEINRDESQDPWL